MHAIVFIPAAIFCAVTLVSSVVCTIIDRRAGPAPPAARPGFRPVVIEGGLKAAPAAYLRAAQSSVRSDGAARPARSAYGG